MTEQTDNKNSIDTGMEEGNLAYIEKEMQSIVAECHNANVICKVIFETCYLSKDEITTLANIAKKIKRII